MDQKNIIAIEIGSSKVKGAVGSYNSADGVLTVYAVEEEPLLDWVRYGAVSNVEELSKLVGRIIRKIENRVSPRKITSVYASIGGRSLSSVQREVERNLGDEREITDELLDSLSRELAVSPDPARDLLAVIPKEYYVNKVLVEQPKGTMGRTLKISANQILCRQATKRNLDILFSDKLHLNVGGYEIRHVALGHLVLTPEEKSLGCMLVDFGAETTTVSIYRHGNLQYLATIPMGSRNITRDITRRNMLEEQAERFKRSYGNALGVTTPAAGGEDIAVINNYVEQRAGEIIANIRAQIKYAGLKPTDLPAGIVIVGRGALLAGFNEKLEKNAAMKVRVGSVASEQRIRITDGRISPADACDVISVMFMAAMRGARECLTEPVAQPAVHEPEPQPQPVPEPEPLPDPDPKPRPKTGRWNKLMEKVSNLMTGEIREEDEDLRDDE